MRESRVWWQQPTCGSFLSGIPPTLCALPTSELLWASRPTGAPSPSLLAPGAWGEGAASLGKAGAEREKWPVGAFHTEPGQMPQKVGGSTTAPRALNSNTSHWRSAPPSPRGQLTVTEH